MQKLLLTICLLAGAMFPVSAALAGEDDDASAPRNWTGGYFGAYGGFPFVNATFCNDKGCANYETSPFYAGGLAGYQHELANKLVLGLQTRVAFEPEGRTSSVPMPVGKDGETLTADLRWAVSLDATLGYDMGVWEPYLGVGAVIARDKVTVSIPGLADGIDSEAHTGFQFLLGAKYRVWRNWTVGAEYANDQFNTMTYFNAPTGGGAGGGAGAAASTVKFNDTGRYSVNSIVATLEYRF